LAYDDGTDELAGMSETEKMLWRAEQEIDDMPISGEGQDFGDGASAYVVAGAIGLVAITLAATGLLITMGLQQMADAQGSAQMAQMASALFFLIAHVWMIIAAFMKEPKFGVMCVFIPFFSFIYACLHRYWFAVFMMVVGGVVYMGATAYIASQSPGYGG
jgi:ABC-type Na+ efflux pump permease subunit